MNNRQNFSATNFRKLLCFIAGLIPLTGLAQGHFIFKANTEDFYVVVVQSATLNDIPLEAGDEIGVFTPAGLCVGATVVQSARDTALTAWQDDSLTPAIDGYRDGEAISFRVWDVSNQTEFVMNASYVRGNGTFGDGPYAQALLSLQVNFAPRVSLAARYSFNEDEIFELPLNDFVVDENHAEAALTWVISGGQKLTGSLLPGNIARFTPAENWFGAEAFTFIVRDPLGASDTAAVTMEVLSVNDLPALQLPPAVTIGEDDSSHVLSLDDYVSDVESADAQISWQITATASVGAQYNAATRTVRLLPQRDFFGATSWQLWATDAHGGPASGTLTINVTPVQDRPSVAQLISPLGDARVDTLNVTLKWQASLDPDGDALTYLVIYGTLRTLTSQVDSGRTTNTSFVIPNDFIKANRRYYWRVVTFDGYTSAVPSAIDSFTTAPRTGVAESQETPRQFELSQNYPNPFSLGGAGATMFRFNLPEPAFVSFDIYDALGRKIAGVLHAALPAGKHEVAWHGREHSGKKISSGIYWVNFSAGKFQALRKILVVK
jgi:hypothetical protein